MNLSGLHPGPFLRDVWQKKPLLVRQALPGFTGFLDRRQMLALAARADAVSRLVIEHPRARRRWERHDGPLVVDAKQLPASHWTVLVHGIESLVSGGWELLGHFDFIPAARIDDLMVSYAAPGGSVGPHDDLYDVFLLQGRGRRRWQIARGGSRVLDDNSAIKVLADFEPEDEWVLKPGDLLYLPPGVAHYGVAEEECLTYSIGFLAPSHADLVSSFLGYLAGTLPVEDALLRDRMTTPQKSPLLIGDAMVDEVAAVLGAVRWDRTLVEDFLGCYLTRPKPHVVFAPPRRPPTVDAWMRRLRERGRIMLALPTRGLVRGDRLYLNGEAHQTRAATLARFQTLVRDRCLSLPIADDALATLLYEWHRAGYLTLDRLSDGG